MKFTQSIAIVVLVFISGGLYAQDNLDDLLDDLEGEKPKTEFAKAAFKSTRVINLQSIEGKAPGALEFRIAHRFGPVNGGAYQLFGLDQATMRMSLEYGFNKFITAGFGRSTFEKTYDFYAKGKILRQQKGEKNIPFSLLYYTSMAINGLKWQNVDRENLFASRIAYVHQIIIGSKVSDAFSFQLSPTLIHKNLVPEVNDQNGDGFLGQNNFYALGIAGRYKLTSRFAITSEYVLRMPPANENSRVYDPFYNSFSVGVDLETGGHVFQFQLTNSLGMFDRAFIMETSQSWSNGGVHFGFNITREFSLKNNLE